MALSQSPCCGGGCARLSRATACARRSGCGREGRGWTPVRGTPSSTALTHDVVSTALTLTLSHFMGEGYSGSHYALGHRRHPHHHAHVVHAHDVGAEQDPCRDRRRRTLDTVGHRQVEQLADE